MTTCRSGVPAAIVSCHNPNRGEGAAPTYFIFGQCTAALHPTPPACLTATSGTSPRFTTTVYVDRLVVATEGRHRVQRMEGFPVNTLRALCPVLVGACITNRGSKTVYNCLKCNGESCEAFKVSVCGRAISRFCVQQDGHVLPGRDACNRQVGTLLPLADGIALAAAGDQHQHMTAIAQ